MIVGARPLTFTVRVSVDSDRVVAVGGVDDHPVGLAVAGEGVEVYLQAAEVGSAQVVDGDDVSAAEGFEVDLLDAGNVHRHVADVADEAQAVSIRGQVDPLGEVGADERHVSVPPWPSTVSLPSPGSQAKVSSPAPSSDRRRP